ncbi:MAG: RNA-guided pseudouridylation complex pseudouridine synthase subunit Cbf5 [Candidatus Methanomethylophilaceae archaeon]
MMLVKDPDALKDRWGKPPSQRSMGELLAGGVIALDKPKGPTSHQVSAWAKDFLHMDKMGHGGTLDPNVSGVLPLCTGKAMRLTDLVLSSDKEYVCLMHLHRERPKERILEVMGRFQGRIYQFPPVRSAVKRQLRIRTVSSLEVLELDGRDVLFQVACDAGTYIRTLCTDIGEALGCGANMEELRRTRSGVMGEEEAVSLHDLKDAYVLWQQHGREDWLRSMVRPLEALLEPLPKVVAKASSVDALCHGADLNVPGVHLLDEGIRRNALVAVLSARGEAVGIGRMNMSSDKLMTAQQGKAVVMERVLMPIGTYPRMWRFASDLPEFEFTSDT